MSVDIYAFCNRREFDIVNDFLRHFAVSHSENQSEYEYPWLAENPSQIFTNVFELMKELCKCKIQPYTIYWTNDREVEPYCVWIVFTQDENIFFGLGVNENNVQYWLNRIKRFLGTDYAYWSLEDPPPLIKEEFFSRFHSFKLSEGI